MTFYKPSWFNSTCLFNQTHLDSPDLVAAASVVWISLVCWGFWRSSVVFCVESVCQSMFFVCVPARRFVQNRKETQNVTERLVARLRLYRTVGETTTMDSNQRKHFLGFVFVIEKSTYVCRNYFFTGDLIAHKKKTQEVWMLTSAKLRWLVTFVENVVVIRWNIDW